MKLGLSSQKSKTYLDTLTHFAAKFFWPITIVIFFIIVACGAYFSVLPKYKKMFLAEKESQEKLSSELNTVKSEAERLAKIKANYDQIDKKNIDLVKAALPELDRPEELLAELENILKTNGFLPLSIMIDEGGGKNDKKSSRNFDEDDNAVEGVEGASADTSSSSYQEINLIVEVAGVDYAGSKRLLSVLESSLRSISIKEIEFTPADKKISMQISAYYFKK